MRFRLTQYNYSSLLKLAKSLKEDRANKLEIELTDKIGELPKLSEVAPFLYQILDYELFFGVWLKNIPYCAVNENCRDHILPISADLKGEKTEQCRNCKYFKRCSGFPIGYLAKYGKEEICPIPDLPLEVMLEIEPRCNFKCQFCFNKISFAKNGRDIKSFRTNYVKKIIDNITQSGVKNLRFTGGEPLLRVDIFELMKYAKEKNLYITLNTNVSLITSRVAERLKNIVDNVLIPVESYSDKKESKITGYPHSLKKKIKAIKLLKKQGIPTIRAGTVASKENILDFDKIAQLILKLPLDEWELYRPIPISKEDDLDSKSVKVLVEKLIDLRKKTEKTVFIANALPFCAIKDFNKLNSVSKGALSEDGHSRLVIDPRGFVKPHYFMDKNIGHPLDILAAWQHPFMKKMRNLKFLPKECNDCQFISKCCGGSRYIAKLVSGTYRAPDPLVRHK